MKTFLLLFIITALLTATINLHSEATAFNYFGYIDSYMALDNDKIDPSNIQAPRQLTYINPYKNQLSLNMASVQMEFNFKNTRGTLALQAGDFVTTAYGSAKMPYLQQANIGYNLIGKFWLDVGYFLTHIGGESVLPKDNWLSSHSIITFFEPFYQSGIKASFEGEQLTACLHILNSNGLYHDNNINKTVGLFVAYKFSDDLLCSFANVIGNEEPGGTANAKTHILNNLVAQYNLSKQMIIKGQIDYASKEKSLFDSASAKYNTGNFFGASMTAHYQIKNDLSATFRAAYLDNSEGVYVPALKGYAITLGSEYKPSENSYIRLEGSLYKMPEDKFKLFTNSSGEASNSRMELILNFGLILKNN